MLHAQANDPVAGAARGIAAGDPAALPAAEVIEKLLGEFWSRKGEEQIRSRSLGEAALGANPGNADLVMAYALNRMFHYRYADAIKLLRRYLDQRPDSLDAWQLLSWSELVTGHHEQSLNALREMKRRIPQPAQLPEPVQESFYRHAGRMIGFLQGPASGHVNPDVMQATITALAEGAPAAMLEQFNSERTAVLDRYDQICKDEAAAAGKFLQDAAAKSAVEAENLKTLNETLVQRREQVAPEVSRLQGEAINQLSQLDQQASPLLAEATAADAAVNQLVWTLNNIQGEIFWNEQRLRDEIDGWALQNIQWRLNQLYAAARQASFELAQARNRLVALQSQLNVLGVQRSQVSDTFGNAIAEQKTELKQIERQQRRNQSRLEDLADGPDRITGEALKLANKKDLVSTYYLIPVALYRERLLDQIAAGRQ